MLTGLFCLNKDLSIYLCFRTKVNVEYTQVGSLGLMSIIGRKDIEDCPLCAPVWTFCISLAHPGRVLPNNREIFHKILRFCVGSGMFSIESFLYLTSMLAHLGWEGGLISIVPAVRISCTSTFNLGTLLTGLLPGVTVAMIPMP